jgi:hypothetical protein
VLFRSSYEEEEACITKMYGLKRVAYEGGVWTDNQSYMLSRITDAMIRYQQLWDKYDGELLSYFVTTGGEDGGTALGFTQSAFSLGTRKYAAIDYLISTPKSNVTGGKLAPCTIYGADYSASSTPWEHPAPAGQETLGYVQMSQWAIYNAYLFRTSVAGNYSFTANFNTANEQITVSVDGVDLGKQYLQSKGYAGPYYMQLDSGLHAIKIELFNDGNVGYVQLNNVTIGKIN